MSGQHQPPPLHWRASSVILIITLALSSAAVWGALLLDYDHLRLQVALCVLGSGLFGAGVALSVQVLIRHRWPL
jgi:hypothetical protein